MRGKTVGSFQENRRMSELECSRSFEHPIDQP